MTARFFRVLLLFAAVSAFAPSVLRAAAPEQKKDDSGWVLPGFKDISGWHLRLKDARAEAAKEDKPILILFSGPDWSNTSKKFESSVFKSKKSDALVGLYVQHFVNVIAPDEQISANESLRKALDVPPIYPCTVILGADGKKVLGIIPGALDRKTYFQQISKLTGIPGLE